MLDLDQVIQKARLFFLH